jgi:hypothetical protein
MHFSYLHQLIYMIVTHANNIAITRAKYVSLVEEDIPILRIWISRMLADVVMISQRVKHCMREKIHKYAGAPKDRNMQVMKEEHSPWRATCSSPTGQFAIYVEFLTHAEGGNHVCKVAA